eukprot:9502213-Pyramimonas_sp.AAC.1
MARRPIRDPERHAWQGAAANQRPRKARMANTARRSGQSETPKGTHGTHGKVRQPIRDPERHAPALTAAIARTCELLECYHDDRHLAEHLRLLNESSITPVSVPRQVEC